MRLYCGRKRNHPTARLRQLDRKLRRHAERVALAIGLGGLLYMAAR